MAQTKQRVTARDLGITITPQGEKGLFRWLMCVILFSKPVQQEIAGDAFRKLHAHKMDTPDALLKARWQHIVDVLGEAHYVRYDESTATRLQEASKKLIDEYNGSMQRLVNSCDSPAALRKKVQAFKGVGKKGADIFLREVQPVVYRR